MHCNVVSWCCGNTVKNVSSAEQVLWSDVKKKQKQNFPSCSFVSFSEVAPVLSFRTKPAYQFSFLR